MRIAICALSAVLLSGCSWLGGVNNVFGGQGAYKQQAGQYGQAAAGQYGQAARNAQYGAAGQNAQYGQNFGGGFPQEPQYGAPQEVTGQYGTHAANANQAYGNQRASTRQMRKPRLRGSLSLGLEKSFSGDILDYGTGIPLPVAPEFINANGAFFYNQPTGFSGNPNDGLTISSDLTGTETSVTAPSISFDDVHSTPLRIAGGLEYIVSPKTTVFANAGYTTAEGNEGGAVNIIGDVTGDITYTGYRQNVASGSNVVPRGLRNAPIAQFSYDFSDLERYDLEVGARRYFNPVLRSKSSRSITPFVGGSVGVAHFNEVTLKSQVELLELHDYVLDNETIFGPVLNSDTPQVVSDSQWVPTGQLNAGLEWQATPKMAIAFETGVKFEGARDYAKFTNSAGEEISGAEGDNNLSVPFTIRGSYNF